MAVIKAGSSQFPFHITDIAALLRLNIRRRGPDFLYVDCPLCGDHRGKLYLKTSRDVWHCNYCQESGGMLALYAKVYGISNADAYREICEALLSVNHEIGVRAALRNEACTVLEITRQSTRATRTGSRRKSRNLSEHPDRQSIRRFRCCFPCCR